MGERAGEGWTLGKGWDWWVEGWLGQGFGGWVRGWILGLEVWWGSETTKELKLLFDTLLLLPFQAPYFLGQDLLGQRFIWHSQVPPHILSPSVLTSQYKALIPWVFPG